MDESTIPLFRKYITAPLSSVFINRRCSDGYIFFINISAREIVVLNTILEVKDACLLKDSKETKKEKQKKLYAKQRRSGSKW